MSFPILANLAEHSLEVANSCAAHFLACDYPVKRTDAVLQRELYATLLSFHAILKTADPLIKLRTQLRLAEVYADMNIPQTAINLLGKAVRWQRSRTDDLDSIGEHHC